MLKKQVQCYCENYRQVQTFGVGITGASRAPSVEHLPFQVLSSQRSWNTVEESWPSKHDWVDLQSEGDEDGGRVVAKGHKDPSTNHPRPTLSLKEKQHRKNVKVWKNYKSLWGNFSCSCPAVQLRRWWCLSSNIVKRIWINRAVWWSGDFVRPNVKSWQDPSQSSRPTVDFVMRGRQEHSEQWTWPPWISFTCV